MQNTVFENNSCSGIIGNTQNLKFVLQAEPEVAYPTTGRDILLRDTDVPPNTPLLSLDGDNTKLITVTVSTV
jgi:hypothetical protein